MTMDSDAVPAPDIADSPPGRRRIQTTSLAQEAYEVLQRMIVRGELAPGERIAEPALCEQLGISRTPLREALRMLASDGLIATRRNRNAVVTRIDPRELEHLFEVEAGIESLAVSLAAERMTNTELKQLEALQERLEKLHEKGDRDGYFALNQRIHALLVAGAKNPVLEETHRRLLGRLERARYLALERIGRWQESTDEHRAILEALKARDGERARRLLADHVQHTGESITQINRD
ncbi:GntR family transcriptional regulator [Halomonas saccharevitans]|uniref:DNA-binding transcriptional regulator, GntR family n=1 Tax=Halomonas saccharevitans TaxID=416872 RepID=A0A1I6XTI2_9GAMM|nr:GntR family transcriptional regulator [Halomonas saccharevitans]MDT8879581.1 GntR family transcriptional regulator [Halomonas saccharevitans]SFT41191.1 DNA-binding transcriptional regulator, GntR family [Halomonas saccharevitans]